VDSHWSSFLSWNSEPLNHAGLRLILTDQTAPEPHEGASLRPRSGSIPSNFVRRSVELAAVPQ
jgi:hypothetical protein